MAEYVEQRMEEMLGEVEQLERVELLTHQEVKELLKKRKSFEYKIQKRTKRKEDFLSYIQYETNLLTLIRIRRDMVDYKHKKGDIDHSVISRINKLFKIMEHRFQSDVKIWLSHLEFLKQAKWSSTVSRVYLRMLQVHSDKPKLWVAASKYEMEDAANPDNARQILLRGLRFHPGSKLLHREYLRLELLFVERLVKRKDLLGLSALEEVHEEKRDAVLDGEVARVVYRAAVEAIKDAAFVVSMLVVVKKFGFTASLQKEILEDLKEHFKNDPITWDTLAREELVKEGVGMKARIQRCAEVYEEGLKNNVTEDMLRKYIDTLKQLPNSAPKCVILIAKLLKKALEFGKENNILSVHHYMEWIKLLDNESQTEEIRKILEAANEKYPQNVDLWIKRIMFELSGNNVKKTVGVFQSAISRLGASEGDAAVRLYEVMFANLSARGQADGAWQLLEEGVASASPSSSAKLRVLLLEQAWNRGVDVAREVYQKYSTLPPFCLEFHNKMLEVELDQGEGGLVRTVLQRRCDQFGGREPGVWLEAARWEEEKGRPLEAARIVCRAETALEKDLLPDFVRMREMSGLNN